MVLVSARRTVESMPSFALSISPTWCCFWSSGKQSSVCVTFKHKIWYSKIVTYCAANLPIVKQWRHEPGQPPKHAWLAKPELLGPVPCTKTFSMRPFAWCKSITKSHFYVHRDVAYTCMFLSVVYFTLHFFARTFNHRHVVQHCWSACRLNLRPSSIIMLHVWSFISILYTWFVNYPKNNQ